jgi:hypothetical protein
MQKRIDKSEKPSIIALDMRTQLNASPIFTQGVATDQVSLMDMDLDGMKQACQIFRDNIYTNKIGAVVREWTCNAIDEHLKHAIDRPVSLKISHNKFSVRDFAKGLDENGIRNVFGKYFRSTKSNSDQPIGGFGVGAKAGHCYNDTFYVTSFFKGTKTIYSCVLGGDDSGASIGQVIELHQEPTDETGLLVEIEIDKNHFVDFLREAEVAAILSTLAQVEVIDAVYNKVITPSKKLIHEENGIKFFALEKNGSLEHLVGNRVILTMGGVYYKIPDNFGWTWNGTGIKNPLQIDVPVGYFDIPISRENYRATPKFKLNFKECQNILSKLIEEAAQNLKGQPLSFYINEYNLNKHDLFCFYRKCFVGSTLPRLLSLIGQVGESDKPPLTRKGKCIICVTGNSHYHYRRQLDDLQLFLNNQWAGQHKVFYMTNSNAQTLIKELADGNVQHDLVFLKPSQVMPKVRTANAKPITPTEKAYRVRRRNRVNSVPMTCLELHNQVFGSNCATLQEAKEMVSEAKEDISDAFKLRKIAIVKGFGLDEFKFNSCTLAQQMIDMGYFDVSSDEYAEISKNISVENLRRRELTTGAMRLLDEIAPFISRASKHRIERSLTDPDRIVKFKMNRLKQMHKVIDLAIQETSQNNHIAYLFFKYMKAFNRGYSHPAREDTRKVLRCAFSA